MGKVKINAVVLEQTRLADDVYSMWLSAPQVAAEAKAGQFVALYCRDKSRMLPRPISLCEIDRARGAIRLVYRVVGAGTTEFAQAKQADVIEVTGPLGNGFPSGEKKALLVGGGIGIPPMVELAKTLSCEKTMVMGYRNAQTFLTKELSKQGSLYIATDDGSLGTKGTVVDAITENALTADVLYACGPLPMLRALKEYAAAHNMQAWLSMEEKMACGIGACLACVCRSAETDAHSQVHNKRVCKEGPVFAAEEIVF